MAPTNDAAKASTISAPKSRLQRLKGALNPALDKLADVAIGVLDFRSELTVNKAECDALALRVAEITESILSRASSSKEMVQMYSPLIKPLQECIDDISMFLVEHVQSAFAPGLARVTENERIKIEIAAKDKRLTDVVGALNLDVNMTVLSKFSLGDTNPSGVFGSTPLTATSQQARTALTLARLPPKPRVFHDRESTLKSIIARLLEPEPAHLALLGMGGIGKTSTAATVLHDNDVKTKYGSNRVFLSCDSVTTAEGIVSALAAALKIPVSQEDDARALILQYFESIEGSVLVVLDNLESAWDTADRDAVEELLTELSNIDNLSLVITMRGQQRPVGVDWSQPLLPPLDTFDLETSKMMYISNGGKTDGQLDDLLRELDGWPLAIVLMAYQGQNRSPSQLLAAYRAERTALLARGRAGHLNSVDVSISLSLNCQSIKDVPGSLELLSLLCLLPDGIETSALADAFPEMSGILHTVRVLEQVSLVTRPVENEIKVLSPIRAFVLVSHPPCGPHLERLEDFWIAIVSKAEALLGSEDSKEEANAQITKIIMKGFGNIMSVLSYALKAPEVREEVLLAILLLSAFSLLVHYGDTWELMKAGIAAGRHTPSLQSICGHMSLVQAMQYSVPGPHSNTVALMEDAKELSQDPIFEARGMLVVASRHVEQLTLQAMGLGKDVEVTAESVSEMLQSAKVLLEAEADTSFIAWCTQLQGTLALATGSIEDAISFGEATIAAFEELHDGFGVARGQYILGSAYISQRKWEEGDELLRTALASYHKYSYREGVAIIHQTLGTSCVQQSRLQDAVQEHTAAAETFASMGDVAEAAMSMRHCSHVCVSMGHALEAIEMIFDAISSYDLLGDKLRCAGCRLELGNWLDTVGKFQESLEQHLLGLQLCEDLDLEQAVAWFKRRAAGSLCRLAYRDTSDLNLEAVQEADRLFREALLVFEHVDHLDPTLTALTSPNPFGLTLEELRAGLKRDLAAIWTVPGRDASESIKLGEAALAVFTELDVKMEIAACKAILGEILVQDDDTRTQAMASMEEAFTILKELEPAGSFIMKARRQTLLNDTDKLLSSLKSRYSSDIGQLEEYGTRAT
ncbi:hypothetical protein CALVIDRAFT_542739 [Calocera viscosa TUFC12733]|uniref:NB-ARC domain-containing protein n=1 Tax=Calocera viscosa (strain TUFC12733) TaxID=1330018 RepID=A0A167GCI0_CALVF|nr:hypothetical protein CALVIDRAFT_542739 [Calocera viscosa TUFC12733]